MSCLFFTGMKKTITSSSSLVCQETIKATNFKRREEREGEVGKRKTRREMDEDEYLLEGDNFSGEARSKMTKIRRRFCSRWVINVSTEILSFLFFLTDHFMLQM